MNVYRILGLFTLFLFTSSLAPAQNSYVGIGIVISADNDKYVVDRVLQGGPADKAGLKKNDQVIKVDGIEVANYKLKKVVGMIIGEEGTTVELTVSRNDKLYNLKAVRGSVKTNFAKGCLRGDCQNGEGTFGFANGAIYTGSFKDGKRKGKGKIDFYSMTISSYHWDEASGKNIEGKILYSDGTYWMGSISQKTLKADGYGKMYSKYGKTSHANKVLYKNGVPVE